MYYDIHTSMQAKSTKANRHPKAQWLAQLRHLWPAIKGSLAQVHKPCIRKRCPACASGKKHPAWILSVVVEGRRSCRYVPEAHVPAIQQAIQNGRKIEALLQKAAVELIKNQRAKVKNCNKTTLKS
jgi:hypothetical protein